MPTTKLTDETRGVLERSVITERTVELPGQLERGLYEQVDKVLRNAGGRWNRRARAHVFDRDPRAALGLAVANGVSVDEKQVEQSFFTPPPLAHALVARVGVKGFRVLEPSAGEGALADEIRANGAASLLCYEREKRFAEVLKAKGHDVMVADFLKVEPSTDGLFDRIVMNPPFTKGQDIKHIRHAQRFLRNGGMLGAICANGPKQRELRDEAIDWVDVPAGAFKKSGTMIATAIVVLGAR